MIDTKKHIHAQTQARVHISVCVSYDNFKMKCILKSDNSGDDDDDGGRVECVSPIAIIIIILILTM